MAFWQTLLRLRRGDLATLVFATFLAFAVAPGAVAGDAMLFPTEAHAVLFWLQGAGANTEAASMVEAQAGLTPPPVRVARVVAPTLARALFRPRLRHVTLDAPVAAYLSGVRTNRFLI